MIVQGLLYCCLQKQNEAALSVQNFFYLLVEPQKPICLQTVQSSKFALQPLQMWMLNNAPAVIPGCAAIP